MRTAGIRQTAAVAAALAIAGARAAGATTAPWDSAAQTLLGWLTGPTAVTVGLIAAAVAIYFAFFSERGGGGLAKVVAFVSVLVVLVQIGSTLWSASGALF